MADKSQGRYKAIVKEGPAGEPFIIFELLGGEPIADFKNTLFGFNLKSDTSIEEAQNIARQINGLISSFFISRYSI
mgnify:CR=1 FL=1